VATVRAIPDDEWGRVAPSDGSRQPRTLGEEVGSSTGMPENPFRHAWAHLGDLQAFVQAVEAGGQA
jgi:hypothetical protein